MSKLLEQMVMRQDFDNLQSLFAIITDYVEAIYC